MQTMILSKVGSGKHRVEVCKFGGVDVVGDVDRHGQVYSLQRHTVTLSPCHHVILSPSHRVTMPSIRDLITRQLSRPSGLLGWLVGRGMARNNVYEAEWTIAVLSIQPTDRVLEVGFGPGVAIALAARRATRGRVVGIEISSAMLSAARRRNAAAIRAGRVDLRLADVAAIPFESGGFNKALSIHSLYFWPQPLAALRELHRVLRPAGRLALTLMPRDAMAAQDRPPSHIFRLYDPAEVVVLLGEAGFSGIQVHASPDPTRFPGVVVAGVKPS